MAEALETYAKIGMPLHCDLIKALMGSGSSDSFRASPREAVKTFTLKGLAGLWASGLRKKELDLDESKGRKNQFHIDRHFAEIRDRPERFML